jgi:putative flippase GtrA
MMFGSVEALFRRHMLFIKFIGVGFVNTIFGYSVYLICLFAGVNFALAALISTVLGIVFNFFTTGRFVFGSRKNSLFLKFVLVYCILYGFTVVGLSFLNARGVSYEIGGAIMILPNALLAFILNKTLVFNNNEKTK